MSRKNSTYSSNSARQLLSEPSQALGVDLPRDSNEAFESAKRAKNLSFASACSGTLVLANTLLGGSGLLGMPAALAKAGYVLGLGLMVVFGLFSAFGCHLLQCSARRIGQAPCSFYTVSNAVVPRWTWLIDGAVMVKCFGVATSYLIIVGDLAPPALAHFGFQRRRWEVILVSFAPAATLACFKNLSGLRFTAAGSMVIVVWTTVLIVLFLLQPTQAFEPCSSKEALPCGDGVVEAIVTSDPLALGKALPVFIFGFTCQQNIFSICNEVRNTTRARVDSIIAAAYLMAGSAFVAAAVLGYLTFGSDIDSDVLKSYPSSGVVAVTRLMYSLLAIFSYPLQIHPARASALALVGLVKPAPDGGVHRWSAITVLALVGSLLVAITVMDLGKILGVVGATGSTMVSYILPGLVYFQAFPYCHCKRFLALGQLLLGCTIMPVCLLLLFL